MVKSVTGLELQVLSSISGIIDKALSLDQALTEVLKILSETLSMKRATITLEDRGTGNLVIWASHGLSPEEQSRGVYRLDEGVTGNIFRTARPYCVKDVRQDPLFLDRTRARKAETGAVSFIGVPIMLHGRPIGVLNVDRLFSQGVSFAEDVRVLTVVATLIAQFISLNDQVEERVEGLKMENVWLKSRLSLGSGGPYIVGESQAMLDAQRKIEKVAATKATVLLLGESGTGKTLIARTIHDLSDRKSFPFIKVNCAAIPDTLIESELFGHERGAFTGATSAKPGRFEDAHKGTIFLDEIGELPLAVQSKLLRVLQEREFERLGSNLTRQVDVRIITATNKDLERLVEDDLFRADLYYRLKVFPIQVPPLRERPEDILKLLNHFLQKSGKEYNRSLSFTPEALAMLKAHPWPGNAREMENLVERLVILAEADRIAAEHVRACMDEGQREAPAAFKPALAAASSAVPGERPKALRDMERDEVVAALGRNGWVQHQAARDLCITDRQMGYRVKKYQLEVLIATERSRLRTALR
jgi:Nif-specific regulatory protein